jgi:hypothetical protein
MALDLQNRPESPYSGGPFWKIRLPVLHYPIDWAMLITGIITSPTAMGIAAIWSSTLGIPIEYCISMFILTFIVYLIPTVFGDPAQHGAITAGIPLYIMYLINYPEGIERIHAAVAMQICLAFILFVLAFTKSADKITKWVPASVKAGILLGAAIASAIKLFNPADKYVQFTPVSVTCAVTVVLFLMFSKRIQILGKKNRTINSIASFSITFGMISAAIVGLIAGEVKIPDNLFSRVLTPWNVDWIVKNLSIFGIGLPPLKYFISGFPMGIVAYILCFGDVLVVDALIQDVNNSPNRAHEFVNFQVTRNYIFCGLRNLFHGLFMPYMTMCGPAFVAGTAMACQRTRLADKKMLPMYWSASTMILWGGLIAFMIYPVVTFFAQIANQSAGINFIIQCFVCTYAAFGMCHNDTERGIAGIMAGSLVIADYVKLFGSNFFAAPAVGLAIGILLHLLLETGGGKEEEAT